jgi:hypothetical protein
VRPIALVRDLYWKVVKHYRPIKYLQHRSKVTWHLFDADIANAKGQRDRNQIESQRHFECAEFDDEVLHIESQEWLARAGSVHISVYDIPLAGEHEGHWATGPYGDRYLSDKVFRLLKKQVEDAEYERDRRKREQREVRIKYFTATAALLAALASIANLLLSAKKK